MQCGELASTVVVKNENAADISSELHLPEPQADGLTSDRALAEPISVENSDNTTASDDTAKVQNEPSVMSTSIPADSNVGTEVVPQSVDSTDTGLKESVLQECLTRTLHRSLLLLFIKNV